MSNLLPAVEATAWTLALWSGLVSALAAALVSPPERRRSARLRSRLRRFALDVALFAPLYCIAFELIGRADLLTGTAFGAGHAIASIGLARRRAAKPRADSPRSTRSTRSGRSAAARILYGALLAFLYPVTPP